jgi:predicted helicase
VTGFIEEYTDKVRGTDTGSVRSFLVSKSKRPLDDSDIDEFLVQYVIFRDSLDEFFKDYPYYGRDECRVIAEAWFDSASKEGFAAHKAELKKPLAKFAEDLKEEGPGARQTALNNLCRDVYAKAFKKYTSKYGFVPTPVQVVDFIVISLREVLSKEYPDREPEYLDPFCGTGIFVARLIQLGLIDEDPIATYQSRVTGNEYSPFLWYVMKLNVEEVFWRHTGGVFKHQPFQRAYLTDTFLE